MGIAGGKVGSAKAFKAALKKGSGGGFLSRIPVEGIEVRFLEEPEEWIKFQQHWGSDGRSFPCAESECQGCADGDKPKKRFAANAVDINEGKVVALELPVTAAQALGKKFDRYGTITDRNYEITKDGQGLDTTYDVEPMDPGKMNLRKYKPIDIEALLEAQIPGAALDDEDDDDDEYEDEFEAPRKSTRIEKRRPAPVPTRRVVKSSTKKTVRKTVNSTPSGKIKKKVIK